MRPMIRIVLFLAGALWLAPPGTAGAGGAESDCMGCHGSGDRPIDPARYAQSVHRELPCTECHMEGYDRFPHAKGAGAPACTDCHGGTAAFDDAARDVKASVHVEMGDPDFGCANCHSPHYFLPVSRLPGPERSFALVNRACNECHAAGDTPEARKASLEELALKHERFPHEMVHLQRVGCVACHTPTDKDTVHLVLPKSKALGECVMCHSGQSLLAAKFDEYLAKKERAEKGWLNAALYNNAYLTGATRHRWLDWGTFLLTALTLAGIGIHALGRWFFGYIRRT